MRGSVYGMRWKIYGRPVTSGSTMSGLCGNLLYIDSCRDVEDLRVCPRTWEYTATTPILAYVRCRHRKMNCQDCALGFFMQVPKATSKTTTFALLLNGEQNTNPDTSKNPDSCVSCDAKCTAWTGSGNTNCQDCAAILFQQIPVALYSTCNVCLMEPGRIREQSW